MIVCLYCVCSCVVLLSTGLFDFKVYVSSQIPDLAKGKDEHS